MLMTYGIILNFFNLGTLSKNLVRKQPKIIGTLKTKVKFELETLPKAQYQLE